MNPLVFPILRFTVGLVVVGALIALAIGLSRGSSRAAYRQDWTRFGTLVGVGLVLVVLAALGRWWLLAVLLGIAYLGWAELVGCVEKKYGRIAKPALLPLLGAGGILGGVLGAYPAFIGIGAATWAAIALPVLIARRPPPMQGVLSAAFGMVFISVPLVHLLLLADLSYGAFAFLIVLVLCNDGFSAGIGRLFGRRALCPHISPNKTWEGALGGGLGCLLAGFAARFLVPGWPVWMLVPVAAGVSVLGVVGGMVASSLKREAGIKDFGRVLPGMGGILDRFDSLMFAAPVYYLFVRWIGA